MIGSSLRAKNHPPSGCDSESEEKVIGDNDDEDCNHKHRRRGTQSMGRDLVDQVLFRPDRKRNKPSAYGYTSKENDFQSNKTWKKRHPFSSFPLAPNRDNQSSSDELGSSRSRGKELSPWIPTDPWLSSVDIASRMVPPGSVLPNIFAKREFPGISNPHGHSWRGGVDSFHLLGSQKAMRQTIGPPQNFMHQRCRDFEERGFCLRGDMCPMDHGVNRIVVEDVQSLSQFNLPVSQPRVHPLSSSPVLPSIGTSSSTMMSSDNSLHRISKKPEMADRGLSNVVASFSSSANGADFYDPDQPLWGNDCAKTSTTLQGLSPSSKFDEAKLFDTRIKHRDKSNANAVGFQSRSSSTRENVGLNDNSDMKERFDSTVGSSHSIPNNAKQEEGLSANLEYAISEGKVSSQGVDLSPKTQDAARSKIRKPTQKALRTLFVSCIPKKDNKLEAILSHFKRFGEVIDIYIPPNGHRAFVQFFKREEAEGALKAPDAVMGNRFIKLMWANRDRITEDVPSSANDMSLTSRAVPGHQAPPRQSVAKKGKGNLQPAASRKSKFPNATVSHAPHIDKSKPIVPNLSKVPSPSQKKPVISAILEEFRKRQESFAQKRDALQLELAKMVKKAAGSKGEIASEQVAKRQKVGSVALAAKAEGPNSIGFGSKMASSQAEGSDESITVDQNSLKPLKERELHEPPSLKKSVRPLAPFGLNRFKLDNRPVVFRITPPLPSALENVSLCSSSSPFM